MSHRLVIDADSHLTEPPDLWTSRVSPRYVDEVPRTARDADGNEIWVLGGDKIATVGYSATAGWSDPERSTPPAFEDCIPAAREADARLEHMDSVGIWAQVLYPNVAGFGSQRFLKIEDPKLRLQCVQAYNDFLHEWASKAPARLITIMSLPFWDVDAAVREIERCVHLGVRGILFTGEPQRFGLPVLGDRYWDPLWSTAQEADLPLHFHLGGGEDDGVQGLATLDRVEASGVVSTLAYLGATLFLKNANQCADLITCGTLKRYERLKFVSVESGIGWIPFVLEAVDFTYLEAARTFGTDVTDLPSDLFRRQVYSTVWFERVAPLRLLEDIPTDNILFETDFPHTLCLYRNVQETIDASFGHIAESDQRKIIWENAAALYKVEEPERDDVDAVEGDAAAR